MIYDISNPEQRQKFIIRINELLHTNKIVELIVKHPTRTIRQNSYLHLCLGCVALEVGVTIQHVKEVYFKLTVNPDVFVFTYNDKVLKIPLEKLKSTTLLTTEELSVCIERFKIWASKNVGVCIPDPEDYKALNEVKNQIEINKNYL